MLIDTDVLSWMTRWHCGATHGLQPIQAWRISALVLVIDRIVKPMQRKKGMGTHPGRSGK